MKPVVLVVCALLLCAVRVQSAVQCFNDCCGLSDVGNIRLTSSQSAFNGAVQICNQAMFNNTPNIGWTYLSPDTGWNSIAATVACRQLGLSHYGIAIIL